MLDWGTLHPVERLELLTTHDLARKEKQKLELLRGILTYFHYATRETREEVLRAEIKRVNAAADELRAVSAVSTPRRWTVSSTTMPRPRSSTDGTGGIWCSSTAGATRRSIPRLPWTGEA